MRKILKVLKSLKFKIIKHDAIWIYDGDVEFSQINIGTSTVPIYVDIYDGASINLGDWRVIN